MGRHRFPLKPQPESFQSGGREESAHPGSGLRTSFARFELRNTDEFRECIVANVALSDNSAWTAIPIPALGNYMVVPQTPSIEFINSNGGGFTYGQRLKLRIRGWNQFGQHQTEETPWLVMTDVSGAATLNVGGSIVGFFSKVFVEVTSIEYKLENGDAGNDTLTIGAFAPWEWTGIFGSILAGGPIDFLPMQDATGEQIAWRNFGIGTPVRVRPYNQPAITSIAPVIAQIGGLRNIGMFSMRSVHTGGGATHDFSVAPLAYADPYASPQPDAGGWLIGDSDENFAGDPNKFRIQSTLGQQLTALDGTRWLAGPWNIDDPWSCDVTFHSSLGYGPSSIETYPDRGRHTREGWE